MAYKLELKKQEEESEGRFLSESDLLVCLMADLQQQQDKETADIMTSALDMVGWTAGSSREISVFE